MKKLSLFLSFLFVMYANEPKILKVDCKRAVDNSYSFFVTVKHNDTSSEHYVTRWEVLSEKGDILAIRILYHPHINEQPFTRALYGIELPNISKVYIRAYDIVHGYSKNYEVILP
ncbi:hypothetical protein [Nitrosophilus labii]|uniref:hypothetical protein n=1 Tax=Nitrosophilus labii TaxID=2706014 RepID=UPI00165727F2|nr:hypothetical protein [Nitrosophilus labii]